MFGSDATRESRHVRMPRAAVARNRRYGKRQRGSPEYTISRQGAYVQLSRRHG